MELELKHSVEDLRRDLAETKRVDSGQTLDCPPP